MNLARDLGQLVLAAVFGLGGGWAAVVADRKCKENKAVIAQEMQLADEAELALESDDHVAAG